MEKKERNIIIHIGMPKSASTSLQQSFFNRLPLINYSGVSGDNIISRKALNRVIFENEKNYNTKEVQKGIATGFKKQLPVVLSHENACMPILKQFVIIPQRREIIANRFKTLYPEAKILIIIRNQFKIHQSMYVQKLKCERDNIPIKRLSFSKWMEWNIGLHETGEDNVFQFADYDSIISTYKNLFSEVKIIVFEEMIKDMRGFIEDDLCEFIGIDSKEAMQFYLNEKKNRRRSKTSIFIENIVRVMLNFLRKYAGNPQRFIPDEKRRTFMRKIHKLTHLIPGGRIDTTYSPKQKKFIADYYAGGNRKVSEMTGIDLEKYGYPV